MRIKRKYKLVNTNFGYGYRIEVRKYWLGFLFSEKLLKTKRPILDIYGKTTYEVMYVEFQTTQEAATLIHLLEAGADKLHINDNLVVVYDKETGQILDLYDYVYRRMVRTHHTLDKQSKR